MVTSPVTRRTGLTTAAFATAVLTTLASGPTAVAADPPPSPPEPMSTVKVDVPAAKLRGLDPASRGDQTVFVQFAGAGSADAGEMTATGETDEAKVRARRAGVARQVAAALSTARTQDPGARMLFTTSNTLPGVVLRLDRDGIEAVADRTDVVRVSRVVPKVATNANSAALTRAVDAWRYTGGLGRGVRIGIIDTGIDYTHKDFGGPGTKAAYDDARDASTSPSWRAALPALGRAKIGGGADFVGDDYWPDETLDDGSPNPDQDPVAKPDTNPLDCDDHGTHVSGTAAGYGVTAGGATFTGDYASLTRQQLLAMKVGPGTAPGATLYGLKVFGCQGSTEYSLKALDWSLDPNGDGDFSDHLDIINLSLGADDAPVDDPENAVVDELTSHGVLTVAAAGNNGDLTDTGSSSGNAVSALAVASSVDSFQLFDGLRVTAPSGVAGVQGGQMSLDYAWPTNGPTSEPVSGLVATIPGANADGCDPLSAAEAARVRGKVAWLEWDDDDETRRCGSVGRSGNVDEAGAIGAIFTSELEVFAGGIAGDDTIPVFQLPGSGTDRLRAAAEAGTLRVTFDGRLQGTVKEDDPSLTDTLSGFSSRGVHGSIGVVKPDVTAPGDTIVSAGRGTGAGPLSISGTSMSSPHTAGIAALVMSRHPAWSPLLVKAAVMNNAGDVWTKPDRRGLRYGPARVGSGRVDALRAANAEVIAFSPGADNPVSASFGVVPARVGDGPFTRSLPLKVLNQSNRRATYALSYDPVVTQPGVSYSVSPSTLTVGAGQRGTARVTMRVDPRSLRHTIDPTMATTQLGVARQYVADASGRVLVGTSGKAAARVPVYGAAKPVSTTRAAVSKRRIDLTGAGFSQGSGSTAWRSYASVLQLGATSGSLPACRPEQTSGCADSQSERAGDIRHVGAGSSGDWLWIGLSTYAEWPKVGTLFSPYVDLDTTGNRQPEFQTYVTTAAATDVLLAVTVDLEDFSVVDEQPINFRYGDVDTNVFDSDVLMLPISKKALGLDASSRPIRYTVATYSGMTDTDTDTVGPVTFDTARPGVRTAGPLFRDAGGTSIEYDVTGKKPVQALVLHLHGATGKRAEVLRLPGRTRAEGPPSAFTTPFVPIR